MEIYKMNFMFYLLCFVFFFSEAVTEGKKKKS